MSSQQSPFQVSANSTEGKTGRKKNGHVWPVLSEFRSAMKKDNITSSSLYVEARQLGRYKDYPSDPTSVYELTLAVIFGSVNKKTKWVNVPGSEIFIKCMRRDGILSKCQYMSERRSGKYREFPAKPSIVYGLSSAVLFGSIDTRSMKYRSLEESQKYVSRLGLNNIRDWYDYCKSGRKPADIPVAVSNVYGAEFAKMGGISWFLGTIGKGRTWTKIALLAYLRDLKHNIANFSPADLYLVLNNVGAFPAVMKAFGANTPESAIKQLRTLTDTQIEKVVRNLPEEGIASGSTNYALDSTSEPDEYFDLTSGTLHALDRLNASASTKDAIAEKYIHQLWAIAIAKNNPAPALRLLKGEGSTYFTRIKKRFIVEFASVSKMCIPAGWSFKVKGRDTAPSLMQRRVAWLLKREKALLNLSGPGAGKTLSGILASRVVGAKLTVAIVHNPTIEGWIGELNAAYPKCGYATSLEDLDTDSKHPQFLFLNYEKFQIAGKDETAADIVTLKPEMVILDEIQFMKKRDNVESSTRRNVIHEMVGNLPESYVLALTATPVVNDLDEPKALLETVIRREVNLDTRVNQQNGLAMYSELLKHSVRYKPEYGQKLIETVLPVTNNTLLPWLQSCENALDFERVLLDTKLKCIRKHIEPGTVIYTHFVTGIIPAIRKYVEKLGLTVGEFTGQNGKRNDQKAAFIAGELDVLIISDAGRVGLDGLQRRSDRLILIGTPWTAGDLEQVRGRVYRQGSTSKEVEIIHPQVSVKVG